MYHLSGVDSKRLFGAMRKQKRKAADTKDFSVGDAVDVKWRDTLGGAQKWRAKVSKVGATPVSTRWD